VSVKADRWIRKMALEKGMITPFVEKQVRQGVVSYGLSSYGYDLRVADEWKVFTNINSTIVDPKKFDSSSFVDLKADTVIIPPNSFALARTVEYLRIPRNVVTICVGKCVTGDTRVVDAETGEYLPIAEFEGRRRTIGMDGWRMAALVVTHFTKQGKKPVFELTTRTGLRIKATANHPFRQLHGWTNLEELKPGDRIAVAREIPVFGKTPLPGWEASLLGLMVSEGQCQTPGHSPVFTNEDPVLVDLCTRSAVEGLGCEVTHNGQLGYRLVNRAGRGGSMETNRASLWLRSHEADVQSADKAVPQAVFKAPEEGARTFLQALFAGDGSIYGDPQTAVFIEYVSMSRRLVEDVHHLLLRFGIVSMLRSKKTNFGTIAHRLQITDRDMALRFCERIGFVPASRKQLLVEQEYLPALRARGRGRSNFDTLPKEAWDLLRHAAKSRETSLRAIGIPGTNPKQSVGMAMAEQVAVATEDPALTSLVQGGPLWDVVESITPAGLAETFDITVPGAECFVANGTICHNSTYARCGIIVNVTPFEPEWEGHATLEISNTTPLPARVYANEGLCQVLFFESDEVCETSYADKKGKYQAQGPEIVLPKM
jgi:deoxycytidine triphosphate deaminase/intein/homing endonuclease